MKYTKLFDIEKHTVPLEALKAKAEGKSGDRRDGLVYLYTPEIELAVNVALATSRPMLVRGPSGAGKSSLARNVALRKRWRYYEEVVTSKTQHSDLEWRFDLLRRFQDAQQRSLKHDADYIEPRALWWAFDPDSARRRGLEGDAKPERPAVDPSPLQGDGAVVLIDEIDKADPDVPNNMLVTLGSLQFAVPQVRNRPVKANAEQPPLVIITSNDERDLPAAFLRRCTVLELKPPTPERLVAIAAEHFGDAAPLRKLAQGVVEAIGAADDKASTAEFLDAIRACRDLGVKPSRDDETWQLLVRAVVRKAATPGASLA